MIPGLGLTSLAAAGKVHSQASSQRDANEKKSRRFPPFALVLGLTLTLALARSAAALPQAPAAAPQNADSGSSKLESVQVTGSTRFRSEQIAPLTGLQPGSMITRTNIQAGADQLSALGSFASVQFRYTDSPLGVKLEYRVTDAPGLPVSFDDFPWATDEELTAAVKSYVALFDGTAPEHGAILEQIDHAIEKFLATRGALLDVTHVIGISTSGKQQVMQFSAKDESVVPKVFAIDFGDALAANDRAVKDRASDIVGQRFSRSKIAIFEFEQVRPIYLALSFLRVRFGAPTAKLPANDPLAKQVVVSVPIDPGPAYAWGGATWTGNAAISSIALSSALDAAIKFKVGDPADGMKIESAWQGVRDLYGTSGYLDAAVNPVPHFDDAAKRVGYSVEITEGPQYRMGDLVLTGLSKDGERRIRAAWKIQPNTVFDRSAYEAFLNDGIQQAFMGTPIRYEKIGRFLQEDAQSGKVNVMLDFQ